MSPSSRLDYYLKTIRLQIIYLVYRYTQDLALNILQGLIYRKT